MNQLRKERDTAVPELANALNRSLSLNCKSDEINIDALYLVIYVEDLDEWSVKELEKISPNAWTLGGTLYYWTPEIGVVQFTAVDVVQNVSIGRININRSQLAQGLHDNERNGFSFRMQNDKGEEIALVITFEVNYEEEPARNNVLYLKELQNAITREPQKARQFNDKGNELMKLFKSSDNDKDFLDLAIEDIRFPSFRHDIYMGLFERYERFGQIHDLDECIVIMEALVDASNDNDPLQETWILKLGGCLLPYSFLALARTHLRLYDSESNTENLEKSISALEKALGTALRRRFELTFNSDDIERAIEVQRKALSLLPDGHRDIFGCSNNLGVSLLIRYQLQRDIRYLEESIEIQRKGNVVMNFYKQANNLATALMQRFRHKESINLHQQIISTDEDIPENALFSRFVDLEAISVQQKAMALILGSDAGRPAAYSHLGMLFLFRFHRTMNVHDIDEAIQAMREAINLTPKGHPDVFMHYNQLSMCLTARFNERTDELQVEDIDEAVDVHRKTSPFYPLFLSNFGTCLLARFSAYHDLKDLAEAISHSEQSAELTEVDDHFLPERLSNLGNLLIKHSETSGDGNMEIEPIDLTPDDHIQHAQYLDNLGDAYLSLHRSTSNIDYLNYAIDAYRKSALHPLNSGRMWAHAFEAYSVCFNILPQVTTLGQTIHNRHAQLKPLSAFATEAAAVAIELGKYSAAVDIVWNQLNSLRSPFDELRETHPSLAGKLLFVSEKLQRASSRDRISLQDEVIEHQKLAREWDTLFEDIVKSIPKDGPVVILNVSKLRSDALVVYHSSQDVISIKLEQVNVETCEKLQQDLDRILASHGLLVRDARAGKPVSFKSNVLGKLWYFIAKPVFDKLSITKSDHPQRLWWCTTGALSFLPIHAAGDYTQAAAATFQAVPELVVSSYTPTLGALFGKENHTKDFKGFLAICQPNTPNLPPIPKTVQETATAVALFREQNLKSCILTGEEATYEKVLQEMGNYSWIHFACHALQDDLDPTKSAIYLQDGQLKISDIIQKPLPHAEFAFLSACQTATGDRELSEEAVHLAAGMLAAGYKSVIASMWSISDEYAPMVSEEVCTRILKSRAGEESPGSSLSARALHSAINIVRREPGLRNAENTSFLSGFRSFTLGFDS
ncbi:CHAT domain-containing protein [Cyathus striatus]|nr:CHAT domain-containing protein [Cyathus striatus]